MTSMKSKFLAAAAAVSLIAATSVVLAQDPAKPGPAGDTKVDVNAQKPAGKDAQSQGQGDAKAGAPMKGSDAQTKKDAGKVDMQAPKAALPATGAAQGQDTSKANEAQMKKDAGKVDTQEPKAAGGKTNGK